MSSATNGKKLTRAASGANQPKPADASKRGDFPVVGIGCSAGGLEALETFFRSVAADSRMAFVVVQHLDPRNPSTLPELIARSTSLAVQEAKGRTKMQPGHIYIIPPNKDLYLLHDTLRLLEPKPPVGLRLPVDFFFRALAEDRQEHAIGVILSGMGSDGMLGLRAIKEKGGFALVQDPAEAKFAGMPRSAIDAGLADFVGPAGELASQIAAFTRRPPPSGGGAEPPAPTVQSALEKINVLLRGRCGVDFSGYKTSTLYRRIERRTALHQLHGIAAYVSYLSKNPQELDLLFKELLIGVTNFFRDPAVWDNLRDQALPELFSRHPTGAALRAWVPACSSGEEAYSLAMVFREAAEKYAPEGGYTLQVYATDIDADAIDKARRGYYPENIGVDVTPQRLARFFVSDEGGWRIAKEIRDMVVFAPHNIVSDPPFTKLDILSCRNLLIYFDQPLQKKLLLLFHYALNRDGLLFLGSAETVGNFTELFDPIEGNSRIFHRLERTSAPARLEFPSAHSAAGTMTATIAPPKRSYNLEFLTDRLIQQQFAPPAVLVNGDSDILYMSSHTEKYLEPAAGKTNIDLNAMARSGLREALTGVIRTAQRQSQSIRLNELAVGTNGGTPVVNVVVQGIAFPGPLRDLVVVVFCDVPSPPTAKDRRRSGASEATERDLQHAREALRAAHEEVQTTVEEYKSANDELQSTNKELQSLNEELQTVNAELESKVDELTAVRNDLTNLLNSTEIATVFLDNHLSLRRFTRHATHLFKLIPSDIGRPLSDIVSELTYPKLKEDAQEVLRTLVFHEQEVTAAGDQWVPGAHHALPHPGEHDRRSGDHPHRHHRDEAAGGPAARSSR